MKHLVFHAVPVVLGVLAVVLTRSSLAADTPASASLLDLNSYWRCYYVLKPAYTSPRLWKTIELPAWDKRLAEWDKAGRDTAKLGERRCIAGSFSHHGDYSPLTLIASNAPPPTGWEQPAFHDATWPRTRFPLLTQSMPGDQEEKWDGYFTHLGGACFRGQFLVADPARVKSLVLKATYRGGLAAWVNGEEVGRGSLPAGALGPDTVPADYPEDAYVLPANEKHKDKLSAGETGGEYREKTYDAWNAVWQPNPFTKEEHDTIIQKRDRVLGPVTIPGKLLRPGANVLAIRVFRSDFNPAVTFGKERTGPNTHYGWVGYLSGASWWHGCLLDLDLRADPPGSAGPASRADGVQVWTEDVHKRCTNREFGDGTPPVLNLLGARQGSYSAQLMVGARRDLAGLAATAGALQGPGGAAIPADAVRIRYAVGRSVREMGGMGVDRSPRFATDPMRCSDAWTALWRYTPRGADGQFPFRRYLPMLGADGKEPTREAMEQNAKTRETAVAALQFFDDLGPTPPATVPADSSQAVWVTVKVPDKAAAGLYTGAVTVKADGAPPIQVPLRLQVFDWRLPDPANKEKFSTFLAMEQSPWGVAKAHKIKPWSDEHFARMEDSLKLMGEMGNDFLMIPVLLRSEFGNREDSFFTWIKGKDGKLSVDFSRFDRYLDIARKYMPNPRGVCFAVVHPAENNLWIAPKVLLRDEAAGTNAAVVVPTGEMNLLAGQGKVPELTAENKEKMREFWKPFVDGVLERMKKSGLEKSVFWGYEWDYGVSVDRNKEVFGELAPGVSWARGAHNPGVRGGAFGNALYGCQGLIIAFEKPVKRGGPAGYAIHSYKGWQSTNFWFSIPRAMSGVLNVEGRAAPFAWRVYPELALAGGAVGVGRVGLDYWNVTYQDGWNGGGQVGMSICTSAWPGDKGIHSSARLEMLREGLQEAEARIAVEKALAGEFGKTDAAPRAQAMLDDRIMATVHMPRMNYIARAYEYHGGWQERSWDLYAAAAETAGGKAPGPEDRARFFGK